MCAGVVRRSFHDDGDPNARFEVTGGHERCGQHQASEGLAAPPMPRRIGPPRPVGKAPPMERACRMSVRRQAIPSMSVAPGERKVLSSRLLVAVRQTDYINDINSARK
jgi:hypothetical protein